MNAASAALQLFVGLAGGLAVGSGMVAFLIVLDIIPRLAQLSRSYGKLRQYEAAVILGSLVGSVADLFDARGSLYPLSAAIVGLFAGCFVGMLAAALTEVINVLPILAGRIGMRRHIWLLLMAMIFGKVAGSLFEWLIY